ncbi:MAG: acyl carrier protein [Candidatus Parcubacteria bacterium]|nr:acyl carrier protein [Candidatus Parcubacteria bacterium]
MTKDEIRAGVAEVIVEQLKLDPEREIEDTDSFRDELGADSLDVVQIIMELEDQFGVHIPDEEAEACETFGEAVDLVDRKVNPPPSS